MLLRTITQVRARSTPGYRNKAANDVVATLAPGTLIVADEEPATIDNLTWRRSETGFWVAETTPDFAILLLPEPGFVTSFELWFRFLLKHEGGYVSATEANRIGDTGGETKWGITKRFHPDLDIKALTLEQARAIYHAEYWVTKGCDNLPDDLAICHADACVNPGPVRAMGFLTHSRGNDREAKVYCELRRQFYKEIEGNQPQFVTGLLRRVDELEKIVEDLYPF